MPVEQLSGDSVTNASLSFYNPPPEETKPFDWLYILQQFYSKYANFYIERHYSHKNIGTFSILRKKINEQNNSLKVLAPRSTRIK